MRATYPSPSWLLHFPVLAISAEEHKIWDSSLYSFLRRPLTVLFLARNVILSTPYPTPRRAVSVFVIPFMWETKFHTHTAQWGTLQFFAMSSWCCSSFCWVAAVLAVQRHTPISADIVVICTLIIYIWTWWALRGIPGDVAAKTFQNFVRRFGFPWHCCCVCECSSVMLPCGSH